MRPIRSLLIWASHKTWDACPNNCMLFKDEDEKLDRCSICDTSRC